MVLGFDIIGSCKKLLQSNNLISSDEKVPETAQEAYREENRLEEASRIDKLVRTIWAIPGKGPPVINISHCKIYELVMVLGKLSKPYFIFLRNNYFFCIRS